MTDPWNAAEEPHGREPDEPSRPPRPDPFAPPSTYRSAPRPTLSPLSPLPPVPAPPPGPARPAYPSAPRYLPGVAYPREESDAAGATVPPPPPGPPYPSRPSEERGRRRGLRPGAVVGLVALALAAGAAGGVTADRLTEADRPASASLPPATVEPGVERPEGSVAEIASTVLPSVVSLQVRGAEGVATGSGFVLREDGYILTNNHVVSAGADGGDIVVLFADGHESTATLVGRTVDYDLAVVKVEDSGLTPLALGDSDAVRVGDTVVAVGAPLGLNGTVTTGIISALNRPVQAGAAAETAFINAIQTDAAINPGNSGGPLVNSTGEVVGINSAIAQPPGSAAATGSIGLGFAIPSNQARRTAEELIEDGVATYPVIGVLLDQRYQGEGVQVSETDQQGQPAITPDGPADVAGIQPGDVILAIDGRPVTESDELIVAIRAKAPGDTVTLRVRTGGTERDVRVVLDEATSE